MPSGNQESSNEERQVAESEATSRRRPWYFRALAVGLSLALCITCLELGLRIWGPEYHAFRAEPLYYSNPRGYFDELGEEDGSKLYGIPDRYSSGPIRQRVPEAIDSDEEIQAFLSRESDILFLGDSFTYGRGVRYCDTYPQRLEGLLAREAHPLKVENLGLVGFDIEEIAATYGAIRLRERFPLVIYGFVLNDFGLPGIEQVIGSDYIDLNNGGNASSFLRRHSSLVNLIADRLDTIRTDALTRQAYLAAFRGENARRHFAILADLNGQIEDDGGRLAIMLFPLLYRFNDYPFQEIHDQIAIFCEREEVPLLDLLPAYSEYEAEELWVHPVDHHPNEIGHEIAARKLLAFLNREDLLAAFGGSPEVLPGKGFPPSTERNAPQPSSGLNNLDSP